MLVFFFVYLVWLRGGGGTYVYSRGLGLEFLGESMGMGRRGYLVG